MAERIHIDHGNFQTVRQQLPSWKVPRIVKIEVRRFLNDLGLGKVNRGRKLPPERLLKYLYALRPPLEFFNKDTSRLTLRDIEHFEKALSSGQVCNRAKGTPYAHGTMVEMRKLLRIFLRWRLGSAKALSLTDWLDTHPRPKTPEFLTEAEIERLYKHCRNARQRFLVAVLFDSGARAEEFHNIRYEDLFMPEGKDNFVKVALKQEYSKTLGRTITLYWKYSLEAVKEYLAERVTDGIKPTAPPPNLTEGLGFPEPRHGVPNGSAVIVAASTRANKFTSMVYSGRCGSHAGLLCGETNMPQGGQRLEHQ